MKILIINDDKELANTIIREIEQTRYEIHYAADCKIGLKIVQEIQYDLIVLDWALPSNGGLSVLKELREQNNLTPTLMLTEENSVGDIVLSFDSGANACVTKPIEIRVLIARMKALIRRSEWDLGAELRYADIRLNPLTHKVWREEREIELTVKEYRLLIYFMRNPEQMLSRTMIAINAWDCADVSYTNSIEVYISYLRKKIDSAADKQLIHTGKKGMGYILKTQRAPYSNLST